ncbi:MAG TPA: alpha/beta hydrolase, partial [Ideonella sp.]|nr:alpha/beta hydrolase [Ideonella sp.]
MSRAATTGFVDVGGAQLYYESRGEGPTLLFVHGFTLDHRMWRRQAEALAGLRVVTCDLRGFGRSSPPGEAPFRHSDDLAALAGALGLAPLVVVGHSIGALYALELCLSRPELVVGFVSLCMSGLGRP